MKDADIALLQTIRHRVQENPDLIQPIVAAVCGGAQAAISAYKEMAADMETLACVAVNMAGEKRVSPKTKQQFEELALSKLEKYDFKTFQRWDWAVTKKEA